MIVLRRFGFFIPQSRTYDRLGLFFTDQLNIDAFKEVQILVWSDVKHLACTTSDQISRNISRGHNTIECAVRHTHIGQLR